MGCKPSKDEKEIVKEGGKKAGAKAVEAAADRKKKKSESGVANGKAVASDSSSDFSDSSSTSSGSDGRRKKKRRHRRRRRRDATATPSEDESTDASEATRRRRRRRLRERERRSADDGDGDKRRSHSKHKSEEPSMPREKDGRDVDVLRVRKLELRERKIRAREERNRLQREVNLLPSDVRELNKEVLRARTDLERARAEHEEEAKARELVDDEHRHLLDVAAADVARLTEEKRDLEQQLSNERKSGDRGRGTAPRLESSAAATSNRELSATKKQLEASEREKERLELALGELKTQLAAEQQLRTEAQAQAAAATEAAVKADKRASAALEAAAAAAGAASNNPAVPGELERCRETIRQFVEFLLDARGIYADDVGEDICLTAIGLAHPVAAADTPTRIDFNGNCFGDSMAYLASNILRQNARIAEVDLSDCGLSDCGVGVVAVTLAMTRGNCGVSFLNLAANEEMSATGALALLHSLRQVLDGRRAQGMSAASWQFHLSLRGNTQIWTDATPREREELARVARDLTEAAPGLRLDLPARPTGDT